IEALEELAALDAQLRDLSELFSKEQKTLSDKKASAKSLEDRLSRGKQSLEEMEKARGDLVGELRQMGIQVERSREKLARCRTEREANAAQREVEELRKLYRDREIELEKLDGLISQGRGEFEQVTEQHGAVSGELGSSEGESLTKIASSEEELTKKQSEREAIVQRIKPELYRRYEMIRKRKGTALAWTRDGTCSACHIRLQPMLFQKLLRADDFGQCPSCNRILYFRPAGQAEAEGQSGSP
ncbi:MAG TPA: C4-type zinc ribbon domain-containing protein, partial [Polyangiaceae bacterium]|nr:C4-type zinc ribbon domain-containing protein [Polyangiaceae bacterium]